MPDVFPSIPRIAYEGPGSDRPLAFKRYDPAKAVGGRTMAQGLRFSLAYWHSLCAKGIDPFGDATMERPWNSLSDPMEAARMRMRGAFELTEKLSIPFFCFHDRDIAPEADSLRETNKRLDEIVALAKELMKTSPTRVLWGTANLFNHPRYAHGAATSPSPEAFAFAAAQVKKALEITKELGGANYVFWGGREGYETLLNTDMKLERENLARFLRMAAEYADEIGFSGQFLIEPKPKEPTKHQYDSDAAACHAFLLEFGLADRFKLNLETNHATLAGHTMQHELRYARDHGILGSVDANQGDELLGWDTDQFPTNLYVTTLVMYEILKNGGLGSGGLNFDAKPRRGSFRVEDLAAAHIAGMDSFARGLEAAQKLLDSGALDRPLAQRYAAWGSGLGASIRSGKESFRSLEAAALAAPPARLESGRQEALEAILNEYL
ncbi:MAG TPA: xylose isomerase [Spirochaetales bacterium]|nr:xylose isomerase [Spirochaetales bacterium]HRY55234.1 xylose isomerase [Spirochaetia bacterium]HRZ63963.1 xylose isomerase [Spirochaetia bacterium]